MLPQLAEVPHKLCKIRINTQSSKLEKIRSTWRRRGNRTMKRNRSKENNRAKRKTRSELTIRKRYRKKKKKKRKKSQKIRRILRNKYEEQRKRFRRSKTSMLTKMKRSAKCVLKCLELRKSKTLIRKSKLAILLQQLEIKIRLERMPTRKAVRMRKTSKRI
jgi:hypothetical protein